ncbi:MAG: hypothetical protein ACPGPE_07775 [Planctomycetota bacterium]
MITSSRRALCRSVTNISGLAEFRTVGPVPRATPWNPAVGAGMGRSSNSVMSPSTCASHSLAKRSWF